MTKLEKLDRIKTNMKDIKYFLEFAHAEIQDLKKKNDARKQNEDQATSRIAKLEEENAK